MSKQDSENRQVRGKGNGGERMRLPFEPRKNRGDWSDWVYRHRIGLLITLVIYLTLAIMFVSYQIVVKPVVPTSVQVELEEEETTEEITEEELKEIEKMEQMMGEAVRNKVSNDDSKFDESLRDSKNSNANEIYEEAERVQEELARSREEHERSLRDLENRQKSREQQREKENIERKESNKKQDSFVRGNVTTAFKLEGRTAIYIDIPAYKCEGGGQVLVNISVNRNGKVVGANVEKATSTSDRCLISEALASARACKFNTSQSADDPQRGTILYTFIAQ